MSNKATDFLIQCGNPKVFDKTIQELGAAVLINNGVQGDYTKKEGFYIMRIFGDAGFLKFAIDNQGYGIIIRELEELT